MLPRRVNAGGLVAFLFITLRVFNLRFHKLVGGSVDSKRCAAPLPRVLLGDLYVLGGIAHEP